MNAYDTMKISELRKVLRDHRKTNVKPVGKMAKHHILAELGKHAAPVDMAAGEHTTPAVMKTIETKAAKGKSGPKVGESSVSKNVTQGKLLPNDTPTVAKAVTKRAEMGQAKADVEPKKEIARTKLIKGSQEAKDFMRMIREKKSKEKNVE
jgi:hypothetical protein